MVTHRVSQEVHKVLGILGINIRTSLNESNSLQCNEDESCEARGRILECQGCELHDFLHSESLTQ